MRYQSLGYCQQYHATIVSANLDNISNRKGVIAHNLLKGIPFSIDSIDLTSHAQTLEHFTREKEVGFIEDCFTVLKLAGFIRIAVQDLQRIFWQYKLFGQRNLKSG